MDVIFRVALVCLVAMATGCAITISVMRDYEVSSDEKDAVIEVLRDSLAKCGGLR